MRPNIDVIFTVKECPCLFGGKICVIQYFFVPLQSSKKHHRQICHEKHEIHKGNRVKDRFNLFNLINFL